MGESPSSAEQGEHHYRDPGAGGCAQRRGLGEVPASLMRSSSGDREKTESGRIFVRTRKHVRQSRGTTESTVQRNIETRRRRKTCLHFFRVSLGLVYCFTSLVWFRDSPRYGFFGLGLGLHFFRVWCNRLTLNFFKASSLKLLFFYFFD